MSDQRCADGLQPSDRWLDVKKIAAFCGISDRWIRDQIRQGRLPAFRHGKRWIILLRDWRRFCRVLIHRPNSLPTGRRKGAQRGAEKGAEKGAQRGAEKGAGKGAQRGAEKGAGKGAGKGADQQPHHGSSADDQGEPWCTSTPDQYTQ